MQLTTIHRYVVAIGVANNVSKTIFNMCYEVKEWLNDQEQIIIITWLSVWKFGQKIQDPTDLK